MSTNHLISHISFSSCSEIDQICIPLLKQTPVKVFDYSRVYPDGGRLELSNHRSHLEHIFMIHEETRNLYTPALVSHHDRFLLTTPWIENMTGEVKEIFNKQLQIQHSQFNLGNEFCIINMKNQFMEVFHFYSEAHLTGLENYYLNNILFFEKFALYFVDAAQYLIKKAEKELLIQPWRDPKSNIILISELNTNLELNNCLINNFEKPLPGDVLPKKFYFETKENQTYLTKREVECVIELVKGKSNREIANSLSISPRTVDSHIDSLRVKAGITQRSQLIKFFIDQGLT